MTPYRLILLVFVTLTSLNITGQSVKIDKKAVENLFSVCQNKCSTHDSTLFIRGTDSTFEMSDTINVYNGIDIEDFVRNDYIRWRQIDKHSFEKANIYYTGMKSPEGDITIARDTVFTSTNDYSLREFRIESNDTYFYFVTSDIDKKIDRFKIASIKNYTLKDSWCVINHKLVKRGYTIITFVRIK